MKTLMMFSAVCTLAASLLACQVAPTKTKAEADAAIAAAVDLNNQAKKVFFEWRDTGKLIKKAQNASKKGDFDKAVKLANTAKRHANYSLEQSKVPLKLYY